MLLLSCFLFSSLLAAGPVFYPKFSQTFKENMTYPVVGTGSTVGTYYYNYDKKLTRIDRDNGKWDRYCGSEKWLRNTKCSHLVSDGIRYLHFPELNYCCRCCDASKGCGVVKPDWAVDATFVEEYKNDQGLLIEKWSKKGNQDNFLHVTKDKTIVYRIDMIPNDFQEFDVSSFKNDFDDAIFNLPQICNKESYCSLLSTCGAIRAGDLVSSWLEYLLGFSF